MRRPVTFKRTPGGIWRAHLRAALGPFALDITLPLRRDSRGRRTGA